MGSQYMTYIALCLQVSGGSKSGVKKKWKSALERTLIQQKERTEVLVTLINRMMQGTVMMLSLCLT